jgi:hypothetical protein
MQSFLFGGLISDSSDKQEEHADLHPTDLGLFADKLQIGKAQINIGYFQPTLCDMLYYVH